MTPIKLHVVAYLTKHIQAKPKPRSKDNRKVKPTLYGEVLTSDQIVERLEREAKEKAEKNAQKEREKAEKQRLRKEKASAARARKAAKGKRNATRRKTQPKRAVTMPSDSTDDNSEVDDHNLETEQIGIGSIFYTYWYIANLSPTFLVQMKKFVSHVEGGMKMMMKLCRQGGSGVTEIVAGGIITPVPAFPESHEQAPSLCVSTVRNRNIGPIN